MTEWLIAERGTGVDCAVEELDDPLPVPWLEEEVFDDDPELDEENDDESTVDGVVAARLLLLVELEE